MKRATLKNNLLLAAYSILVIYAYVFVKKYGSTLLPSLINFIIYFWTFLLVRDNEKLSQLNKDLIRLFKSFYFYISVVLVIPFTVPIHHQHLDLISFLYTDLILSAIILTISLYLFVLSLNPTPTRKTAYLLITIFISLLIVGFNQYGFIRNPNLLLNSLDLYSKKNHIIKLISILLLLSFWLRYYRKYVVLSEYLSLVVFIFTLSNILEALHYIAFQYKFELFLYSQFLGILLNFSMAIVWLIRYYYLQSDIGKKNEQYLANFQYLDGLVSKPKSGLIQRIIAKISINYIILLFSVLMITIFFLYLGKLVNLYLFLNTVFILVTTLAAVFMGFNSIRREWQNQVGFFWKNKTTGR